MFKRQTVSTMFTWFLGRPFFDKYMLVLDYTNENSDYVNIGIGVLNDQKPAPPTPPPTPVVDPSTDEGKKPEDKPTDSNVDPKPSDQSSNPPVDPNPPTPTQPTDSSTSSDIDTDPNESAFWKWIGSAVTTVLLIAFATLKNFI